MISEPRAKGMQKLFWLREHGPRMVLPHTRGKPVTFLCDGSLEECHEENTTGVWLLLRTHLAGDRERWCHEENTTGVWLLRADSGEIEKDTQHAVLRQMKGRL